MRFAVRVRVSTDLLGFARVFRLLRRHHMRSSHAPATIADHETDIQGTVEADAYPLLLAIELARQPNVLETVIERTDTIADVPLTIWSAEG